MYNLAESLRKSGCIVHVIAFNTKKHFIPETAIDPEFRDIFNLKTVYLDASINKKDAFLNLFSNESYNIKRFVSENFIQELIIALRDTEYDIVQMEGLFMAPYLDTVKKYSNAMVVLRAHNVEYVIWERLFKSERNILKKAYLKLLAGRLKKYEHEMVARFDAIIPLTPDDEIMLKALGASCPFCVIPVGIDVASYRQSSNVSESSALKIFHLGSMDWMPNLEAVDWFLHNVWAGIRHMPGIELHLAGKAMPENYFKMQEKNMYVYGRIDNARSFMSDKQVMIVPLLSGSGMRVKIIEGLAAGKVIISTTIGAEGIKYTHNQNMLIANQPSDFMECIKKLKNEPRLLSSISVNAIQLAATEYDNSVIAKGLINFYRSLLNHRT